MAEAGLSWYCSLCAHCIPLFLKFQISKEFCTAVLQARRYKEDFKNFSDVIIEETQDKGTWKRNKINNMKKCLPSLRRKLLRRLLLHEKNTANFYRNYMIWSFLHKTGYISWPTKIEPGTHKVFDLYTWSWEHSLYKKPGFP